MRGSGVSSELADVVASIVTTLDSTQDISKYIEKFDHRKWSVMSFLYSDGEHPKAYATLDADDVWITYKGNVTMQNQNYSQILFV